MRFKIVIEATPEREAQTLPHSDGAVKEITQPKRKTRQKRNQGHLRG